MLNIRLIKGALALLALAAFAAAQAQNVVGSWNGKMDMSGVKPKDANEKAMLDMMKSMMASMSIKLNMKADKTYHIDISGTIQGKAHKQTEDGKWSQSGKTITVVDPKGKKETMTVSSDGKRMVMVPRSDEKGPKGAQMIFTRA